MIVFLVNGYVIAAKGILRQKKRMKVVFFNQ